MSCRFILYPILFWGIPQFGKLLFRRNTSVHLKAEAHNFSLEEQTKQNEKWRSAGQLLAYPPSMSDHVNRKQFVRLHLKGHQCHLLTWGPAIPLGKMASWQSMASKQGADPIWNSWEFIPYFQQMVEEFFNSSQWLNNRSSSFFFWSEYFLTYFLHQFLVESWYSWQVILSLAPSFEMFSCAVRE